MGELFEMPFNLPKPEVHEEIKQFIYLEFDNPKKRAEGMPVLNKLRETEPDIFAGLQSIKVDSKRPDQGLELSFSTSSDNRSQQILDCLHREGIKLNTQDGTEEFPYTQAA
jgi:hypothetical protein